MWCSSGAAATAAAVNMFMGLITVSPFTVSNMYRCAVIFCLW